MTNNEEHTLKDFLLRDLAVGDTVVAMWPAGRQRAMVISTVVEVGAGSGKRWVRVKRLKGNGGYGGETNLAGWNMVKVETQ
jgi:hypothetical protein